MFKYANGRISFNPTASTEITRELAHTIALVKIAESFEDLNEVMGAIHTLLDMLPNYLSEEAKSVLRFAKAD